MRALFVTASMLLALAAAGCEEKSSAPQATVSSATPAAATGTPAAASAAPNAQGTPAAAAATAGAAKYAISSDTSKIEWTGAKITGKHEGGFKKFSGTIDIPASGKPEEAKIAIDIDASSLTADQEKLVGHLKSPDFFDVAKFTTIKFTSSKIEAAAGPNGATHTITGNLDLHGVTKSISFPAKVTIAGDAISATSEFQVNRQDFGLKYPGKPDDLIKDNVVVKLDVKAAKAK
jgi:polyisoprenoid-binding protein YceI